MIVHNDFIFIHFPRTSGGYIRLKLKQITGTRGFKETHAKMKDINFKYDDKFIFSIIRNPYDWYVSEFINRDYEDFSIYIQENKGYMTALFFDTYSRKGELVENINFFKYEYIIGLHYMHDTPFNVTKDKKDYKYYYNEKLIEIVNRNDEYLLKRFNYKFGE